MAILFSNNASTTVSGSITAVDTTVALAAGSGIMFPAPVAPDYFVATFYDQATKTVNEIVHVTNVTGDVATIVRGQEGTTPHAWTTGDIFANLITAGTLRAFVQAVAVPAGDTTKIYVGDDTSVVPNHIVANTNPVPPGLQEGMVFVIRVANANTTITDPTNYKALTDMALNGGTALPVKNLDGSDLNPIAIIAGEEYFFLCACGTIGGPVTHFTSTITNTKMNPPQFTFYVRSDSTSTIAAAPDGFGMETNTGFANTPTAAFRYIQGAINTIKKRYIGQNFIKICVADGTYNEGLSESTQYVTQWEIQGNDANPSAVILNCVSTGTGTSNTGGPVGSCVSIGQNAAMTVHGFTFHSNAANVYCDGGHLLLRHINYNGPTNGFSGTMECALGGSIGIEGNCTVAGSNNAWADAQFGGLIGMGHGATPPAQLNITNYGGGTYWLESTGAAVISIVNFSGWINVSGGAFTYEYIVGSGGGIGFEIGTGGVFPASNAGIVIDPGWVS